MSEPTLSDILDAINGLGTRLDRVEQRLDALEQKVDQGFSRMDRGFDLMVQGFAALGVAEVRTAAAD